MRYQINCVILNERSIKINYMSPRTPEQYESMREERKQQIMDVALRLFAEQGYVSTSINKIASEIGVSKGLMYNYFSSKDDLLHGIFGQMFDAFGEFAGSAMPEITSKEDFSSMIDAILNLMTDNKDQWRLYMSVMFQPSLFEHAMSEFAQYIKGFMASLVQYFTMKGTADPLAEANLLAATIDGVGLYVIANPEYPLEAVKKVIIEKFA